MINLLSFNIRTRSANDGVHSWPNRRTLVVERIRAANPDLIGLQECRDDEQAGFLKTQLPEYEFFGVHRGDDETGLEMAPILYRRAAFDELERGCFWLSETPDIPGSLGWGAIFPRTAQWVRLRPKGAGQSILFLNTHLDYEPQATLQSAIFLRQRVEAMADGGAALMCGDFNAEKESPVYHSLLANGDGRATQFSDAFRIGGGGQDNGTFHDFGRQNPPSAIDWILMTHHFSTLSAGVDRNGGPIYPSDHHALFARVKIKKN